GDGYRRLAALIASGGPGTHLLLFPNISASFLCLLVALITTAYGYARPERGIFCAGGAAAGVARVFHGRLAVRLYSICAVGMLALPGVSTVSGAAISEGEGRVPRELFPGLGPAAGHHPRQRRTNPAAPAVDTSTCTS